MAGETLEFGVIVDATQAQTEIKKFSGNLSSLSEVANKPIGSLKDLQDGAQKLQQKLAPTAAAISGVASALGQTGGEAGKVVAGIGQMAAAFGAGGPWAVAIVGGTMLLDEYMAAQKEIERNTEIARSALAHFGETMTNNTAKATQELADKLKKAREEIENFGKSAAEVDINLAKSEIAKTEARIAGADDLIARAKERAERIKAEANNIDLLKKDAEATGTTVRKQLVERMKSYVEELGIIKKITEAREDLTVKLKTEQDLTRGLIQANKEKKQLGDDKDSASKTKTGDIQGMLAKSRDQRLSILSDFAADVEKRRAEEAAQELKRFEDAEKEKTKIAKEQAKERAEAEKKAAKEKADAIAAIEKQQNDMVVGIGQSAFSQLLSSSQGYIDAKIKGEKDAEQKAIASFLSATGQQLVASGTRAIFEGAIMSANPLTPGMGAGMIGTGVAAIAAGLTMGGVGTAMTPPPEKKDGGASRERGASPRSSRGGGGDGGPLVINVSYGVGGPLPEDTAREIAKVMRTGDRRRGAA